MKKESLKKIIIWVSVFLFITLIVFIAGKSMKRNEKTSLKNMSQSAYSEGGYLLDKNRFNINDMVFPVALPDEIQDCIEFTDSYGLERTYGGSRKHQGCDIMTKNNIPGEYPIVSVCDGTVTNLGWLELGGYRIGITDKNGIYYYYAHLNKYSDWIKEGQIVKKGLIIGYIGDTGYSKVEGTSGNFPVHLHFGIYLNENSDEEYTVNPYYLLIKLKKNTIKYNCQ